MTILGKGRHPTCQLPAFLQWSNGQVSLSVPKVAVGRHLQHLIFVNQDGVAARLKQQNKIHILDWDLRCPHQATSFKIRILPPETSAPETREKIPSLRIEKRHPLKNLGRYEFGAPWRWTNDLVVFTFWCRFPNTLKLFGLSLFLSLSLFRSFIYRPCVGDKLGQNWDWPTPLVGFLIMWVSNSFDWVLLHDLWKRRVFDSMSWAWTILFPCTHRTST